MHLILRRCTFLLLLLCLLAGLLLPACRPASPTPPPDAPADTSRWTLIVRQPGPHWLGPEWWRAHGGLPQPELVQLVKLGAQGEHHVPSVWVETPDGLGMLFYGETQPYRVGDAGGYLLTVGKLPPSTPAELPTAVPPTPTPPVSAAPDTPCQTVTTATLHLEQDNVYRSTAPLDLPWLWQSFTAPAPDIPALTLTVPLTAPVAGPVAITLRLWGQSSMPADPDHHLLLSWNGETQEHYWDGSAPLTTTFTFAAAQEENTLTLSFPGDTAAPVEMTWLDAITIRWPRALAYAPSQGKGAAPGWQRWDARTAPAACWQGAPEGAWVLQAGTEGAHFFPLPAAAAISQQPGDTGWLGLPWEAPAPAIARPYAGLERAALAEAAYLVVAPPHFHAALGDLIAAHTVEFAEAAPALLTPAQVYDTFGSGVPGAAALHAMVATLSAPPEGKLRYLLLAGDATTEPWALWDLEGPWVPTAWVRTRVVGETASDSALVPPHVAVGRFPARNLPHLRAMVAKTLAWQPTSRLLLLQDDEGEFTGLTDRLSEIHPPDLRLDAGQPQAREDALTWLDEGPGVMVYSGHGSLPMLGDEQLLTQEDAGAWDGPTVVAAWTCLCAGFTHPAYTGLAEAWLQDRRGVVAFVGPTGETTTAEQSEMALALQRALFADDVMRLGDALRLALPQASDDARASFLLLGDPALVVSD